MADLRGALEAVLFAGGDPLTEAQLLEILETVPFESCQQTVEMLREEVEKHRDGAEPNDDLTMLCVKVIKETEV